MASTLQSRKVPEATPPSNSPRPLLRVERSLHWTRTARFETTAGPMAKSHVAAFPWSGSRSHRAMAGCFALCLGHRASVLWHAVMWEVVRHLEMSALLILAPIIGLWGRILTGIKPLRPMLLGGKEGLVLWSEHYETWRLCT